MLVNPLKGRAAPDERSFCVTRDGLHQLAEQVLAADRFRHSGRIGLQATPGGFAGPWEIVDGAKRCVRIEGTDLVLINGEHRTAQPISTVRAAADLLGIDPAAPPVYRGSTNVDPDALLQIDEESAAVIADWFEFGAVALERFLAAHPELAGPTVGPTLWPEHFDLAVTIDDTGKGELVLGVSPGDPCRLPDPSRSDSSRGDADAGGDSAAGAGAAGAGETAGAGAAGDGAAGAGAEDLTPYAYVSWQGVERDARGIAVDGWWNRPWGRWVPAVDLEAVDDLVELFEAGLARSR